jgi:hypothetical protein
MTTEEALRFVRTHGVVLEAGEGPVPSLASAIAGKPIRGSWWGHKKGREIFALTRFIRDHPDVLVCRLIEGKITYVHRRVWRALVRVADRFPRQYLARVHEKHTVSGQHVNEELAFPQWVPRELAAEASALEERDAVAALGGWCASARSKQSRAKP